MGRKPKRRLLSWEVEEPQFIIINEHEQVYTGLIRGYPNFSNDINEAKPLEGQEKFNTLKRLTRSPLEQMFI
jgi:hypothetical protein